MKNLFFLVLLFNGLSCFSQQGTYIWTLKSTTCGSNGTTYESLLTNTSGVTTTTTLPDPNVSSVNYNNAIHTILSPILDQGYKVSEHNFGYGGFGMNTNVNGCVVQSFLHIITPCCNWNSAGTFEESLPDQVNSQQIIFSSLVPNPGNEFITIYFESSLKKDLQLNIYNQFGLIIESVKINTISSFLLNIQDLASGIYFFRLTSGSLSSEIKKFVKI